MVVSRKKGYIVVVEIAAAAARRAGNAAPTTVNPITIATFSPPAGSPFQIDLGHRGRER